MATIASINPKGATYKIEFGARELGGRIKEAREEKGLTTAQLANTIGVGVSQITGFENRGIKPRYDNLVLLAAALDVDLNWLCEHDFNTAQRAVDLLRGIES